MTGGTKDKGQAEVLRLVHAQGFPQATAADGLVALGLTSLQLLQLTADIEQEFGLEVDVAILLDAPDIGALADALHAQARLL